MAARRKPTAAAPDPAERRRLLDAAADLAPRVPWTQLRPATVCKAAGVPPARFRRHFADLTAYLVAAQQQFMDSLRDRIVARTEALPTGEARLRAAAEVYLDGCLEQIALRGWFVAARQQLAALVQGLQRQNHVYGLLIGGEFRKLGWPHPAAAARIYLAMLMEAGLAEQEAGRPRPDLRETLWEHLRAGRG